MRELIHNIILKYWFKGEIKIGTAAGADGRLT